MPITTTTTSASTSTSTTGSSTTLADGTLTLRYTLTDDGVIVECAGRRSLDGVLELEPELWRAWLSEGLDLVVEPTFAGPDILVRLTDAFDRDLLTTDGEPTPVAAQTRLRAHVLFADSTGMSFKIALGGAGAARIDLADLTSNLRPPPPRLPPDPPRPN